MKIRVQGRAWRRKLVQHGDNYGLRLKSLKGYKTPNRARVYSGEDVRVFFAGIPITGFADGRFHHIFEDGTEVVEK